MNRQEFLERLRLNLNGKIVPEKVTENINFYEDYISTEVRKGRDEADVLAELGDPRLIARTIVEAAGGSDGQTAEDSNTRQYEANSRYAGQNSGPVTTNTGLSKVPGWVWLVLVILVIVLIFSAIFSVIAALLPVLLPILFVLLLVKIFRDWAN